MNQVNAQVTIRPLSSAWLAWLPLTVLPALAITIRSQLQPWAFMWLLAIAIYAGCKWQSFWRYWTERTHPSRKLALGYLLFWPGMDPRAFFSSTTTSDRPSAHEWAWVTFKIASGATLIWCVARFIPAQQPLVTGWIGMLGLVLLLHFGTFHLAALIWQRAGLKVRPIMQSPLRATSLSDFWGRRWNLGFRQLTHELVFQPLFKQLGPRAAILATFGVSGLIHDLVISLPAQAGYCLPTAYFLLQGLGVLFERSAAGKKLGLQNGVRGSLFTLACTAAPAFWLFHPPFVIGVINPFLRAVGGL